jgi:hypothetical protein
LDFFVNTDPDYAEQLKLIFARLEEAGFFWNRDKDFISREAFVSMQVRWKKSDTALKLDFVNDSAPHFGGFTVTDLFEKTDSIRNILSNKLTALFRYAAKDVADIREIALHESVDWPLVIREAREKEMGLEIPVITEILKSMPEKEFEGVNWIRKPSWEAFCADMDRIVLDMMSNGSG